MRPVSSSRSRDKIRDTRSVLSYAYTMLTRNAWITISHVCCILFVLHANKPNSSRLFFGSNFFRPLATKYLFFPKWCCSWGGKKKVFCFFGKEFTCIWKQVKSVHKCASNNTKNIGDALGCKSFNKSFGGCHFFCSTKACKFVLLGATESSNWLSHCATCDMCWTA